MTLSSYTVNKTYVCIFLCKPPILSIAAINPRCINLLKYSLLRSSKICKTYYLLNWFLSIPLLSVRKYATKEVRKNFWSTFRNLEVLNSNTFKYNGHRKLTSICLFFILPFLRSQDYKSITVSTEFVVITTYVDQTKLMQSMDALSSSYIKNTILIQNLSMVAYFKELPH